METRKLLTIDKKRIFLLLSSLFLYAGCVNGQGVSGASREQVVNHLHPILEVEERASQSLLQIQQLGVLGQLEKEHYDAYSIHHGAAAIYLAQGDISNYESHVQPRIPRSMR